MWKLTKYARCESNTTSNNDGNYEWKYFDATSDQLELSLGENGHLLLVHGATIMESYNLNMVQKYMRGQSKGDSMIIFYNMQDVSHRFRMKFEASTTESSAEACMSCASRLAKFFSVKVIPLEIQTQQSQLVEDVDILQGEVTLQQVANAVTSADRSILPLLYSVIPTEAEDVNIILKLCLSDPSFPAYVAQVEREIYNLKAV